MGEFTDVCRVLSDFCSRSVASESAFALIFLAFLGCFEMGSRDIIRGLGASRGPMSTVSIKLTFLSQLDVAAIEVGRVIVERIIYDIVPRSNCFMLGESLIY